MLKGSDTLFLVKITQSTLVSSLWVVKWSLWVSSETSYSVSSSATNEL